MSHGPPSYPVPCTIKAPRLLRPGGRAIGVTGTGRAPHRPHNPGGGGRRCAGRIQAFPDRGTSLPFQLERNSGGGGGVPALDTISRALVLFASPLQRAWPRQPCSVGLDALYPPPPHPPRVPGVVTAANPLPLVRVRRRCACPASIDARARQAINLLFTPGGRFGTTAAASRVGWVSRHGAFVPWCNLGHSKTSNSSIGRASRGGCFLRLHLV